MSFQRLRKWYFPSRIVLTKCVENFSKCNLKIFYGIKIEKMEAKVLFEVEAVGRDLGMVRGLHFFNRDTIENFQITRGNIFQTLSQTISGGECFFAFSWLFRLTSLFPVGQMVISILCMRKRVLKFIQFFAFSWLFKLTSLFMVRFSKKFGYPTFHSLLVKLLFKNSKMALFLTYLLREKS